MDDIEHQRSIHRQIRESEFYAMLPPFIPDPIQLRFYAKWLEHFMSKPMPTEEDVST